MGYIEKFVLIFHILHKAAFDQKAAFVYLFRCDSDQTHPNFKPLTRLRGAGHGACLFQAVRKISIHPPAWGGTAKLHNE